MMSVKVVLSCPDSSMKLSESEERFKDLFEHTSDLIHFLDIEGNIQFVNTAWLDTLGYTFEEVKGTSIYDYIHPDSIAHYEEYRAQIICKEYISEIETAFITRKGEKVLLEGQISCKFRNGKPYYTRGLFRNVTIRKVTEQYLKMIITSAPDAVIVIDQESIILNWNPKAETIFGYAANEAIGKKLNGLIIPERYREAHDRGMKHFMRTGEGPVLGKTIEITALHRSGREFYINLSISAAKISEKWFFIAFASDITDRKNTEEALIRKEAELLYSKAQDQKKDEFISIASHELKTPLTSVKAYIQLLQNMLSARGGEEVKYIGKANEGIEKLHNLISELLDVSRIQAGKLQLNITEFNFDELVDSCIESIGHISEFHNVQKHGNANVMVNGDRNRIEQVLMNYLTNAAKYSPKYDKIIVNVSHDQNEIRVGVTDFGIGISKEKQSRIFERFYRVEDKNHSFPGLGIGLYISAEIIKRHNGRVWVDSEEEKGSTFFFTLPVSSK